GVRALAARSIGIRPEADADGRDVRLARPDVRVLASPRPRAELRVRARRVRARGAAADRRADDGAPAAGAAAVLVRLEPRPLAHGDAVGRRRRGGAPRGALPDPHAAGR